MIRLVRAELLKLRTTHVWWIFGLTMVVFTVMAILTNSVETSIMLDSQSAAPPPPPESTVPPPSNAPGTPSDAVTPPPPDAAGTPPADSPQNPTWEALRSASAQAANLYTSGQFVGLLLVMILGALLITNEFHHQTATITFLTTPTRTVVVLGKLVTGVLLGFGFWLLSTFLSVVSGALVLNNLGYGPQFGEASVLRAVALNLVAYIVWAILGVGLGVLIRNQIAAVIVSIVAYFIGLIAQTVIMALAEWLEQEWMTKAVVLLPSAASQLMTTGADLPGNPPQWVGAAVLVGYGVVFGVIGTLIMRTRDIT